ncbi:MAG TPA: FAD-dependent oxidoreductase, partial [Solirubrobacteraceae bacterium]|nr:FAD-dependent oxidoreductase [Solirubrobacteraceae bacterium]
TPYTIEKLTNLEGAHQGQLEVAHLRNTVDSSTRELPTAGAFIAIGHVPQSELVAGQVELDESGYVVTQARSTLTNLPGVFAAGDLVDHTYRQAITAAGTGCQAALDAEWYLRDAGPLPADALAQQAAAR